MYAHNLTYVSSVIRGSHNHESEKRYVHVYSVCIFFSLDLSPEKWIPWSCCSEGKPLLNCCWILVYLCQGARSVIISKQRANYLSLSLYRLTDCPQVSHYTRRNKWCDEPTKKFMDLINITQESRHTGFILSLLYSFLSRCVITLMNHCELQNVRRQETIRKKAD